MGEVWGYTETRAKMLINKFKSGDTRQDGYRFWSYTKVNGKTVEKWCKPESFKKMQLRKRIRMKIRRQENDPALLLQRANYREKQRAIEKSYKDKNQHQRTKNAAKRRAILRGVSIGNEKIIVSFYEIRSRISKCLGIEFHVDHIKPICAGGFHHENNLRIITAKQNLSRPKNGSDVAS